MLFSRPAFTAVDTFFSVMWTPHLTHSIDRRVVEVETIDAAKLNPTRS